MNGLGSGIMEIVTALIGIALITLLVNKSSNVKELVSTGGNTLNDLLRTVTLQNGMGL